MADPFTWAAIGLSVIGGGISAYGSTEQGHAQQRMYDYQSSVDRQNITTADQQRQQDIATANLAAQDKNQENVRRLAAIRASYGTSGLEMSGSALDVLTDTSVNMALDSQRISYEGQVKGRQGALKMLGYQDQQTMDTTAGRNARSAGNTGAGSALLGGFTNAAVIGSNAGLFKSN